MMVHVDSRGQPWLLSLRSHALFFKAETLNRTWDFLIRLGLLVRKPQQLTISLELGLKHTPPWPGFHTGAGDQTEILMFVHQALPTQPSPQSHLCVSCTSLILQLEWLHLTQHIAIIFPVAQHTSKIPKASSLDSTVLLLYEG